MIKEYIWSLQLKVDIIVHNSKERFRDYSTDTLLLLIQKINRIKDRSLASKLYDLSQKYDPRPDYCSKCGKDL